MAVDLVARKYVTPADMACSTGFMVFHLMPALRSRVKTQLATTSRSLLWRLLGSGGQTDRLELFRMETEANLHWLCLNGSQQICHKNMVAFQNKDPELPVLSFFRQVSPQIR